MSEKIQYGDKSPYQTLPDIPENNKITAENINEIKKVVNNNAEELDTAQKNIEDLQNGQGTSNKDIADLKSKVSTLEEDNNTNKADISSLKKDNNTNKTNISNLEKNKVDKINGKQLSTNDFTNAYKEKLDKLKNYDDTEIKEDISNIKAEQIEQNSELDNLRKDISNIKEEQTQQNTDIEDLQAENNKLKEENEKIKGSLINAETEGKRIHIENASNLSATLEVLGNAEQETRQGYNIFDYLKAITLSSVGGLTIDKDYSNGYITINGTPVNDYVNLFSTIDITDILEDGETYTIWQEKHTENELDGLYMQVTVSGRNYFSSKENVTFTVDKSLGNYMIGMQVGLVKNTGTFSDYKNRYMLYKGTDTKDYELPGASPSLDYPSKIVCLENNVEITCFNKNVAKNIEYYNTKQQYATMVNLEYFLKKDRSYRVSFDTENTGIQIYLQEGNNASNYKTESWQSCVCDGKRHSFYFIGRETKTTKITWGLILRNTATNDTESGLLSNLMIEEVKDSTTKTTDYVEHKEQNYTLPIQQEMLEGDYFVKESDGWKEVHNWEKIELKGTESWQKSSNIYTTFYFTASFKAKGLNKNNIICTHFKSYDTIWNLDVEGVDIGNVYETTSQIRFDLSSSSNISTVSEFKELVENKYNSGNAIIVYVKLAEPEKLACTEEQTKVLEQLNNLKLYKYTNNIFTAEDIAKLKLNYVVDTKKYIDNIIANTNKAIVERS